jgi:hypothetical protein
MKWSQPLTDSADDRWTFVTKSPFGLVAMVLLVFMIERHIALSEHFLVDEGITRYKYVGRTVKEEAVCNDILILGDSLAKQGLLPRLLEERTGRRAYNLGLHGCTPLYAEILLRQALDAGAKPSVVVIAFEPMAFMCEPRAFPRMLSEVLEARDILTLAWRARDPAFLAETVMNRWIPSVRNRLEIRKGPRGEMPDGVRGLLRNWVVNRGAEARPSGPSGESLDATCAELYYGPTHWTCQPLSTRYLDQLIERARGLGIRVVWVVEPCRAKIANRRAAVGMTTRFDSLLRYELKRHPNLTVMDSRNAGYGDDQFCDSVHLNVDGIASLTLAVADQLKRSQNERWIDLSESPRQRPKSPIETTEMSFWAVATKSGVTR